MNKARRKKLSDIVAQLDELRCQIEEVMEEEQDAFDNLPESIQGSEKGEQMEDYVRALEEAASDLEDVIYKVNEVIEEV